MNSKSPSLSSLPMYFFVTVKIADASSGVLYTFSNKASESTVSFPSESTVKYSGSEATSSFLSDFFVTIIRAKMSLLSYSMLGFLPAALFSGMISEILYTYSMPSSGTSSLNVICPNDTLLSLISCPETTASLPVVGIGASSSTADKINLKLSSPKFTGVPALSTSFLVRPIVCTASSGLVYVFTNTGTSSSLSFF